MDLMNRIASVFKRSTNLDPGFFRQSLLQYWGGAPGSTIQDVYREHDWTYAAIEKKANAVAACPIRIVTGDADEPSDVGGTMVSAASASD